MQCNHLHAVAIALQGTYDKPVSQEFADVRCGDCRMRGFFRTETSWFGGVRWVPWQPDALDELRTVSTNLKLWGKNVLFCQHPNAEVRQIDVDHRRQICMECGSNATFTRILGMLWDAWELDIKSSDLHSKH
jgi:hypothetical protein